MRSLGRALIQCVWCPYEKGKLGHGDRHAQREDVKTQGQDGHVTEVMHLQAKDF